MKAMKKSFCILFLLVLMVCNFVTVAFAAVPVPPYIKDVNGVPTIGVLPVAYMCENYPDFSAFWDSVLTSGRTLIWGAGNSLYVMVIPEGSTPTFHKDFDNYYYLNPTSVVGAKYTFFPYSSATDTFTSYTQNRLFTVNSNQNVTSYSMTAFIGGDYYNSANPVPSVIYGIVVYPDGGRFDLVDDLSKDPPPVEPTPTPPPVEPPKPPEVTQPPLDYPTFPKVEGEYIFYDTTVWNDFAHRVRTAMGSSANIGFKVFGIIMGIMLVIRIVKTFTGIRNRGGD